MMKVIYCWAVESSRRIYLHDLYRTRELARAAVKRRGAGRVLKVSVRIEETATPPGGGAGASG